MNAIIRTFPAAPDADLMICPQGVAYQADMGRARVRYDNVYLKKVLAYQGNDTARAVNLGRCALMSRYLEAGATVLDVGAGSGEFVRAALAAGFEAKGYEVIPGAAHALRLAELYDDDARGYDAVSMWDAIEHMDDPAHWLTQIHAGAMLFVSIPVFEDLARVRESKHYRPGEHLYYWTAEGFAYWLALYGFTLCERSNHEIEGGRDSIGAFAFRRGEAAN